MIDLVCLVADKSIEAAMQGILGRPKALGIRAIESETIVHPNRDPGCFHQAIWLLVGYRSRATHALVVLDRAWEGAPAGTASELEQCLEASLSVSTVTDWARAVVIDPELEAWVFSDSPHTPRALGWSGGMAALRSALTAEALWIEGEPKPRDPKAAVEWALRKARVPRSSSIYRELAGKVSLSHCEDRSFIRLRSLLGEWFGEDQGQVGLHR
jgi:hypothetical protein